VNIKFRAENGHAAKRVQRSKVDITGLANKHEAWKPSPRPLYKFTCLFTCLLLSARDICEHDFERRMQHERIWHSKYVVTLPRHIHLKPLWLTQNLHNLPPWLKRKSARAAAHKHCIIHNIFIDKASRGIVSDSLSINWMWMGKTTFRKLLWITECWLEKEWKTLLRATEARAYTNNERKLDAAVLYI